MPFAAGVTVLYDPTKPLILQSDTSVLLEVDHPAFEAARDFLARFAELEASPEHVHTYRISRLSLWNAAAMGMTSEEILEGLAAFSRFPIPENVAFEIRDTMSRYGRLVLLPAPHPGDPFLRLTAESPMLMAELRRVKRLEPLLGEPVDGRTVRVAPDLRGPLKQQLLRSGHPVRDLVGHVRGAPLELSLRATTRTGQPFMLRPYQRQAADAFWAGGGPEGGSGVVVLPCGAGKTLVGIAVMARAGCETLILCTNTTAVRQWIRELLDKTTLTEDVIGEYSGLRKEIRPVTVATYHILTTRRGGDYPHFRLFGAKDWGLIIYDEVHLLPAPVFRMTADLQARRRLGLTATLVREDGREDDVFSLIGPKRYDAPWKDLERQGWIAKAVCTEIRVGMSESLREACAFAEEAERFRLAAENPAKDDLVVELVQHHRLAGDRVLVIGRFLGQLARLAGRLGVPAVTGEVRQGERERLFERFRSGDLPVLVVSNVANFSVDLPEATVAIEVSGTYGSRQEEAQRLGRILRPKEDGRQAHFYALVSQDSEEQAFAFQRQRFLTEQGYRYRIVPAEDWSGPPAGGERAVISLDAYRRERTGGS